MSSHDAQIAQEIALLLKKMRKNIEQLRDFRALKGRDTADLDRLLALTDDELSAACDRMYQDGKFFPTVN